jgi:hypothetical protein
MTTIATLPTAWALLNNALRARRPVEVLYHGRRRLICPHALGWSKQRPIVLGYQTGGDTTTGSLPADERKRWRCLFVDEINEIVAPDPATPWGTADNYNHLHPFAGIDNVAIAVTPDDHSPTGH